MDMRGLVDDVNKSIEWVALERAKTLMKKAFVMGGNDVDNFIVIVKKDRIQLFLYDTLVREWIKGQGMVYYFEEHPIALTEKDIDNLDWVIIGHGN